MQQATPNLTPTELISTCTAKPRRTPAQIKALKAYNFAVQQQDRYEGSVFVNARGAREHEAKVQAAYAACKALGMDYRHGL